MWNRIAADAVLISHLAFILFIVLGGFLALRWRWMPWVHLPTVAYGALIEFVGWTCPLTPLEQRLRIAAGQGGYRESFVEHYIVPIIYPSGYSFGLRMALGTAVVVINVLIYVYLWHRFISRQDHDHEGSD